MKLETLKEENKQEKEAFNKKKKQQDENHKIMVNMRRDIKRLKSYKKKLKERKKKKESDFFEEVNDYSMLLPEDLDKMQEQIRDLEHETDHLMAIRNIEIKNNEEIFKKMRIEKEQLRQQIEVQDKVINTPFLLTISRP